MSHYNTILNQITAILPRHEFSSLAKQFHKGAKFRTFNRWSQFMMMFIAQLTDRKSLRDIIMSVKAQSSKLYHLGIKLCSKDTLARTNQNQPAELYENLFLNLLKKCKNFSPNHRFKFKGKIYLLDATIIDLCLSAFPWAEFRQRKGAIKLNVGLDADGYLPEFVDLTTGKKHEINWARTLRLPAGSMAVFDMGFTDYGWYQNLCERKVFFVTRLKSNAKITKLGRKKSGRKAKGILTDRKIRLGDIPDELRLIEYEDPESGKKFRFVTNAHHLDASTVAALYKERWQIELFFKWIKQNLKIKTFLGTSRNAVLTQIWIALIAYLLVSFLKFKSKIGISIQQILRLLQLNLFERRNLADLLNPKPPQPTENTQLLLFKII